MTMVPAHPAEVVISAAINDHPPRLRVGRQLMFNLDSVEAQLHRRSERSTDAHSKVATA